MKPNLLRPALATLVLLLAVACGQAPLAPPPKAVPEGCPSTAEIAAMVERYHALQPVADFAPGMSMAAGRCGAARFAAALAPRLGAVAGYKAGLTNPAVQQRFGHNEPVRGTLFAAMLLKDGTELPARFGARPFAEADLVVEVAGPGIHEAATPAAVMAQLRAVIPFIELPDLLVQDPAKISGAGIVAINVGARHGVLGTPLAATPAMADALRTMTVRAFDAGGKEIAAAPGAAILGHPLNAVIWLAADLKKAGITLKAGDLLSLGSFSPPLPVAPGGAIRVVYDGLPGQPAVRVSFK